MDTKLGRIITYLDGLLSLKSHDPLITWSHEMTGQTKTIIHHNRSPHCHQTWKDGDLPSGAPKHKFI